MSQPQNQTMKELESFASIVKTMEDWFNKPLKGDQFDMFVSRLGHIPAIALREIAERIIDENQPTPAKFPTPNRIKELWHLWLKDHPGMAAANPVTDCGLCLSHGLLWFCKAEEVRKGSVVRYETVFLCPSCKNWVRHVGHNSIIQVANVDRLTAMGYQLMLELGSRGGFRPPAGGAQAMADQSVKRFPGGTTNTKTRGYDYGTTTKKTNSTRPSMP